ncbi:hypothetical protein [Candidatus Symbiopectobacterium sp. NZEC135]|uniref:hypothetical protein n=1 Tax=Candidatus Symbiopectobacterium sp. NZEC135 TaxID=2820471 RepID=UPI00222725E6|nr:hypothetical protein [Candidatus Symbiopectobacterium sp. NZEC135]MCW2479918.1 hypothetical protein [Candidatus Symbiopectobacterium sp. NZEC135]
MDSSKVVNTLVNRITFGSVSRDTLAKNILSGTVNLAQQYACEQKLLGERSAEIVSLGRSVLFDNTVAQVKEGASPLVSLLMEYNGNNSCSTFLASKIAERFLPDMLQDHALERILCVWSTQESGSQVMKLAIENALTGVYGGKMIAATFMSVLKRTILDKAEYQSNTALHRIAAKELQRHYTQSKEVVPEISLCSVISSVTAETYSHVSSLCLQSEVMRNVLQLPAKIREVFNAFLPMGTANGDKKTVSDLIELAILAHKTQQPELVDEMFKMIAELPKEVRGEFQNKYEQLKPLLEKMPLSTIAIGQNWLNELESVSFEHHDNYAVSSELTAFMKNGFSLPVKHPEDAGGYFAGGSFINALRQGMALHIDNSHKSYGQRAVDMGGNLFSIIKDTLALPEGLSEGQKRQVGQLSDMVNHHPMSLLALTHHIAPKNVLNNVGNKVLNELNHQSGNVIFIDNRWMKLGPPQTTVTVSKSNGVDIATQIVWPVEQLGSSRDDMLPLSSGSSTVSTTVNSHLMFNENGLKNKSVTISDINVDLAEKLTFSQPLETYTASASKWLNSDPQHGGLFPLLSGASSC